MESWTIVGHGPPTSSNCGDLESWKYCPHCGPRPIIHHCDRPECCVCYEKWADRRADLIAQRLAAVLDGWGRRGRKGGKISHYSLSLPPSYNSLFETETGYRQLRADAYKILKKSGVAGGVLVAHSHRQDDDGTWKFSPHFHILGAGFIQSRIAHKEGWVLKKIIGRRETEQEYFSTAKYILSHAGLFQLGKKDNQREKNRRAVNSISWFGLFGVAWVRVSVRREIEKDLCECGGQLYLDEGFNDESWRICRVYSFRIKPMPPPIQTRIRAYMGEVLG